MTIARKDWLNRRVQLGHNRTLLHELEEEDITSFNNYFRLDPSTSNETLERITPEIKKLTTNYKEPIHTHVSDWLLHLGSWQQKTVPAAVYQLLLQGTA